jgi:uncharacterized protein YndB with AHSA1/START domain
MSTDEIAKKEAYISVNSLIHAPVEEVWPFVAAVGIEKLWYHGCTKSTASGGPGKGAIRVMQFPHGLYTERIEDCDPTTHRFVYKLLQPHDVPAKDPFGVIQLEQVGTDVTKVTWTAYADSWGQEAKAVMGERLSQTYENSISALRKICEA